MSRGARSGAPSGDAAADILRVDAVRHVFRTAEEARAVTALDGAELGVARGELMCLIGPSGCGKSTLLNIMGGMIRPAEGRVTLGGREVTRPMPDAIAFVSQENSLFPWLTVRDNIEVALEFRRVAKRERAARALDALRFVGLENFADCFPHELSGGMKQRASLARALSLGTDILLMDEPFAALDEQTRMLLGEELSVLLARAGKTIVFVTHSLAEAVFLADRVAVFTARPGRIKAVIAVEEGHPRTPDFVTSEKFARLRNELYALLRSEIVKTMAAESPPGAAP